MREVLFSICVTAVIAAICKALAPSGRYMSQMKLLISCFFVLTVVNAVSGMREDWDLSSLTNIDTSYNDYSVQIGRMASEETANCMKRDIAEKLAEEGIFPEKIYIDVNISDNGSISISEIKLVFGSEGYERDAQRAIVLVRRMTGTRINVTAELTPQAKKGREGQ